MRRRSRYPIRNKTFNIQSAEFPAKEIDMLSLDANEHLDTIMSGYSRMNRSVT